MCVREAGLLVPVNPTNLGLLLGYIPFLPGAWFYLELTRQFLTYALEAIEVPGIVKRMVEFPRLT